VYRIAKIEDTGPLTKKRMETVWKAKGEAPVAADAIETGFPTPAHPVWDALEISLRSAMSEALLGQKTPKQALDELARDWQRNLRRVGVGKS
jgi:ABC-type glycerol-3-phosphate transport system substrate-binding protein